MLDMQIKIAYSVSEERKRLAKRGREERPWVLERQKTLSNQRLPSFWILQLMRSHSLELSFVGQPYVYKTTFPLCFPPSFFVNGFLLVEPKMFLMNTIVYIFESSFSGVITFGPHKTTVMRRMLLCSLADEALRQKAECSKATEESRKSRKTSVPALVTQSPECMVKTLGEDAMTCGFVNFMTEASLPKLTYNALFIKRSFWGGGRLGGSVS